MKLSNVRISTKIAAVVIALSLASIGYVALLTSKMRTIETTFSYLLDNPAQGAVWLARANNRVAVLGYASYKAMVYDGESDQAQAAVKEAKAAVESVRKYLGEAESHLPGRKPQIDPLRAKFETIAELATNSTNAAIRNDPENARLLLEQANPLISDLNREIARAITETASALDKEADTIADDIRFQSYGIMSLAIGVGVLVLALTMYLSRKTITRPLGALQARMIALAGGDLSVEVEGQERGDEIGRMAEAVQVFKANAVKARELEAQATAVRAAAEKERAEAEALRAEAARQQARVVEKLAEGLSHLAHGDLTSRLSGFPSEYGQLESDFNAAIGKLEDALSIIAANGRAIQTGSCEISQGVEDLSRRTEQQAASLEETAAAVREITGNVRRTADGAKHARDVVNAAKIDAEGSGQVVDHAVEAMNAIQASAEEITQIIGVIDEIAFQTNLLALNAGVEAARAGEAGKGFAVVASEVRALAQRSADAAKQIKGLISTSSDQVASGVTLVGEAGDALRRIMRQVSEIAGIVTDIATSAQEQSTGLEQVNVTVMNLDQITQQNAAMTEESNAATQSLAREAEQLNGLLGRFRTKEAGGAAREAIHPHPAGKKAGAGAGRPVRKTITQLRTTVTAKADPDADTWTEF